MSWEDQVKRENEARVVALTALEEVIADDSSMILDAVRFRAQVRVEAATAILEHTEAR